MVVFILKGASVLQDRVEATDHIREVLEAGRVFLSDAAARDAVIDAARAEYAEIQQQDEDLADTPFSEDYLIWTENSDGTLDAVMHHTPYIWRIIPVTVEL